MCSQETSETLLGSPKWSLFQVGRASVTSFLLFLSVACSPPPSPQHFLAWELLSLPSSWYSALGQGEQVFLQTPRPLSPWAPGLSLLPLPPPRPLPSPGFVPMFGLQWPWPGSKKELFLSPCIVLSPIPKMGSDLGGPPSPQLQERREEGRTWQSWEKGGVPSSDSTYCAPKHTHTRTRTTWPLL